MDMDFSEPFDFDAFINWPNDPSAAHAGAEDGLPLESADSMPDYSADSANEDTYTVTAAPMPSHGDADTLNSDQELSSINPTKKCACIVCLGIGVVDVQVHGETPCYFNCGWHCYDYGSAGFPQTRGIYWATHDRVAHERTHFRQDPKIVKSPLSCTVENCRFSTRRWSDLMRHTTTWHCKNPSKFECSEIGCKYHGEGNGFTRKDKLTEHCRKMHQGQKVPSQAARAIMPAPAAFHANVQGSSSSGAYGA